MPRVGMLFERDYIPAPQRNIVPSPGGLLSCPSVTSVPGGLRYERPRQSAASDSDG